MGGWPQGGSQAFDHAFPSEFEDDKISLPFVVTDLRGHNLRPMRERAAAQVGASNRGLSGPWTSRGGSWCSAPCSSAYRPQGQYLTVEQLTLDFEYVINEVIRHDATWGHQFCSFSDYDIVILEVGPGVGQAGPGPSHSGGHSVAFTIHPPGLPRNQPGPHQHRPAATGVPVPHGGGPAPVSGQGPCSHPHPAGYAQGPGVGM